jgi:hypothetical protein
MPMTLTWPEYKQLERETKEKIEETLYELRAECGFDQEKDTQNEDFRNRLLRALADTLGEDIDDLKLLPRIAGTLSIYAMPRKYEEPEGPEPDIE